MSVAVITPIVKLRRPELDEFNVSLLNCPVTSCKGRASLEIVKGGYKCHICCTFYEYLELDDRPNFVDWDENGGVNASSSTTTTHLRDATQEQRLTASRQAAANNSFAAKIDHMDRDQVRRSLAYNRVEAQQLQLALDDIATPITSRSTLKRELATVHQNIQKLESQVWQIYCERRISAAKHLLARHFGDTGSGRPLGEHLATRALSLFSEFVKRRPVRIHNVRCALCASIVVVSSQFGEARPFCESDVWRRLNVPTGVVATRPQSNSRRHCLPELHCDLTQSIRSYRREMSELMPQMAAVPSRSHSLARLVNLYVFNVSPPLCQTFRRRVDNQLALTLEQLNDSNDAQAGVLQRCSDATLASAIICSALHSFFVPLQGQVTRVSAQWVTRLTKVSRGRIQTVSHALKRLPLV